MEMSATPASQQRPSAGGARTVWFERYNGELRLMHARACFAIAILAALAAPLRSQSDSASRRLPRIIGVFESRSGQPVEGVQVRDLFSGDYALTTSTGTAALSFLSFRGAAAMIELRKLGYQAKQILVSRADTAPITEVLGPVVELAPMVTTEKFRIQLDAGQWSGFEQRCQSISVTCIRDDDLAKKPSANLADLLSADVLRRRFRVGRQNRSADRSSPRWPRRGAVHAHERQSRRSLQQRKTPADALPGRLQMRSVIWTK